MRSTNPLSSTNSAAESRPEKGWLSHLDWLHRALKREWVKVRVIED
ncbi:MAG TPA: hypothetical protein V6C98_12905 [Thermosynechococcaceae cyanobacterium]